MNSVIDLLCRLLKFRSITPDDAGAFEFIKEYMSDFKAVSVDKNGVKNLILSKEFSKNGTHLAFAGHIDVVPPGDGWSCDPFSAICENGYIYGRGTQDMKSGVAAFLWACKNLKSFNGKISIILTSDEEGEAVFGTLEALKFMKENDDLPEFAIVAEPTCDKHFADTIKVGRRGSINGILTIKGMQGHVAYPEKCINPAHELAKVFSKFAGFDLDSGSEFFSPSKIVITDIRGGIQTCNVTPNDIKIMFNVRNSDKTSKDDLQRYIDKIFSGIKYDLVLKQSSKPFLTDKDSLVVSNLIKSIKHISGITPELNTKGGTSDARYLAQFGVKVAEFGVVNDRIHAIDERVKEQDVLQLCAIFEDFLTKF